MTISSRTPEGSPNRCPMCGHEIRLEPSVIDGNTADAPCPHCGCLVWFDPHTSMKSRRLAVSTKEQIRNWLRQFSQFSRSETDPVDYYRQMLIGLVVNLSAHGGVVWTPGVGVLKMQTPVIICWPPISKGHLLDPSHLRLLERVLAQGEPMTIQPRQSTDLPSDNGNPTQSLLLLSPVKRNSKAIALVEMFQRTGSSPTVQRGYLRFLQHICELAAQSTALSGGKTLSN